MNTKAWIQSVTSLVPRPPLFLLPLAHTIIHRSGSPLLCIIVNTNGRQKQGRPGNEAIECDNEGTV